MVYNSSQIVLAFATMDLKEINVNFLDLARM